MKARAIVFFDEYGGNLLDADSSVESLVGHGPRDVDELQAFGFEPVDATVDDSPVHGGGLFVLTMEVDSPKWDSAPHCSAGEWRRLSAAELSAFAVGQLNVDEVVSLPNATADRWICNRCRTPVHESVVAARARTFASERATRCPTCGSDDGFTVQRTS